MIKQTTCDGNTITEYVFALGFVVHISLVLVGMSVCGKLCFKQGPCACMSNTHSRSKISSQCVDDVALCVNHDFWLDVLTFVH